MRPRSRPRLRHSSLLAALALVPAGASAQQPADPYEVLDRAAARFASIGTLCADFHQSLDVPLLRQSKEGTGRMCQRGKNLFSMRFRQPAGDVVVVDGSHLWVYYPSQDPEQVFRAPLRELGVGLDFQREFLEAPREKYRAEMKGAETAGGEPAWRIRLVPRADAPYRDADVWIGRDDRLLRRVEIREENGSVRTITLSDIEVDPALGGDVFTFEPPASAHIVSR